MVYFMIFLLYFYCVVSISITLSSKIRGFSKGLYSLGFFNVFASITGFYCIIENIFGSLTTVDKMVLAFGFALMLTSGFSVLVGHLPDKKDQNSNARLCKDPTDTVEDGNSISDTCGDEVIDNKNDEEQKIDEVDHV